MTEMNRETREMMLTLTNDEGFYSCAMDIIQSVVEDTESVEDAMSALAADVEDCARLLIMGDETGLTNYATNILERELDAIDFDAIADYYREDAERILEEMLEAEEADRLDLAHNHRSA